MKRSTIMFQYRSLYSRNKPKEPGPTVSKFCYSSLKQLQFQDETLTIHSNKDSEQNVAGLLQNKQTNKVSNLFLNNRS